LLPQQLGDLFSLGGVKGLFPKASAERVSPPRPIAGGLITAAVCDYRGAVVDGARFGLNEVSIGIPMPAVYVRMLAYGRVSPSPPAHAFSARSSPRRRRTGWGWCTNWRRPIAAGPGGRGPRASDLRKRVGSASGRSRSEAKPRADLAPSPSRKALLYKRICRCETPTRKWVKSPRSIRCQGNCRSKGGGQEQRDEATLGQRSASTSLCGQSLAH
jgi:hypothetical protein